MPSPPAIHIPDELAPRAEVRSQALANGTANREAAKPFPAAFQPNRIHGLDSGGVGSPENVWERLGNRSLTP